MSLTQVLELIHQRQRELLLVNCSSGTTLADELGQYFETQNVRVRTTATASHAPSDIAVLSGPETVLAVVSASLLEELVADGPGEGGVTDTRYESILKHLKETTFTSYDTEQMLYASREIEDRARRTGGGAIYAGFQRFSVLREQQGVYTDLTSNGLDVHTFGVPDVEPPSLGSGQTHAVETEEIATSWFVVFDGGGDESQKSALLAEEREPDSYYGAWTYDAAIVDAVRTHLDDTYLSNKSQTRHSES